MPRKANPPDPQRQLMIKTKTCQRLQKEVDYYQKEVQENEAKLVDMKAKPTEFDEYDIKRFQQVLDESYMMVPDSQKRFQQSIDDLKNYIQQLQEGECQSSSEDANKAALEGEWFKASLELLQQLDKLHAAGEAEDPPGPDTNVDDLAEGEAF